jgi:hypothetical protein
MALMNTRSRTRLVIPAALVVTVIACSPTPTQNDKTHDGGGGSIGTGGSVGTGGSAGTGGACQPVPLADAGVLTYECKDGRMCGAPDPTAIDAGGVYQVCPGTGDCATLVSYDGGSMSGYC